MLGLKQDASNAGCARSAEAFSKLLVVGLYGEAIKVDWLPEEDTVGDIKTKAFRAAESYAKGVSLEQLRLMFGYQEKEDAVELREEARQLRKCLSELG
jgi:hypothetical protein